LFFQERIIKINLLRIFACRFKIGKEEECGVQKQKINI